MIEPLISSLRVFEYSGSSRRLETMMESTVCRWIKTPL